MLAVKLPIPGSLYSVGKDSDNGWADCPGMNIPVDTCEPIELLSSDLTDFNHVTPDGIRVALDDIPQGDIVLLLGEAPDRKFWIVVYQEKIGWIRRYSTIFYSVFKEITNERLRARKALQA